MPLTSGMQDPRLSWIIFYWGVVVGNVFFLPRALISFKWYIPRTWTITDSRVSCIKPWILTVQRREYDLNGIPHWVHWIWKLLTAQHERLIPIIWSNICDCNTGSRSIIIAGDGLMWFQSKVEEAEFNDVPAGNCDIPDACAVLRIVTWKIWSWKESTKAIKVFARGTSWNKRKQTMI